MTNHKKVITLQGSPPSLWSFFDFGYSATSNPIEDWYEGHLSERGKLGFDALLKINAKTNNPQDWFYSNKHMTGKLKGHQIWQWTIRAEIPYRVLGVFWGTKKAVFLMGYSHKGDVYTPTNALETAIERKRLLEKGACKLHERPIKFDQ